MPHIDFYFDFISPYAYFASRKIRAVAARYGASLTAHPVVFGALLGHHGQLGPAEIPAKRLFTFNDIVRIAAMDEVPLAGPAVHPFNPLTALRLTLAEVAGPDQWPVIDCLYTAGWGRGIDLGEPEALARALTEAGLDGPAMVAATREPAVKAALRQSTEAAIERGVFGVPTFVVGDALVWGADRLHHLELILEGRDPVSSGLAATMLARPGRHRRR
jgi:2-hydroxychromene-2-carboxylate isomerase